MWDHADHYAFNTWLLRPLTYFFGILPIGLQLRLDCNLEDTSSYAVLLCSCARSRIHPMLPTHPLC